MLFLNLYCVLLCQSSREKVVWHCHMTLQLHGTICKSQDLSPRAFYVISIVHQA